MTCTCEMVGLIAGMGGLVFGVLFILMLLFYVKVTDGMKIDEENHAVTIPEEPWKIGQGFTLGPGEKADVAIRSDGQSWHRINKPLSGPTAHDPSGRDAQSHPR